VVALLALAVPAAAIITGGSAQASREGQGRDEGKSRILVIMLENHSQSSVIDDANAPYITHLAHANGMATH
jgi:hypothetical protein